MNESTLHFLVPLLTGAIVALVGATYFLGRLSSSILADLPRLKKKVEGDTEEKGDNDIRHGLEGRVVTVESVARGAAAVAGRNERVIRALCHVLGISTGSGELELETAMRDALGKRERGHDAETTGARRALVVQQDKQLQGFDLDRFGTPLPPEPEAPHVPRPAGLGMTPPPPPPAKVLPKGGRLMTPPPHDSRHQTITGPHKVYVRPNPFPPRDDDKDR